MRRSRPRVRLLFDENLSWKVASALRRLDFHIEWMGGPEQERLPGLPPTGSSDETVLEHARRTNQIVVSANYDLFMLAAERSQTVVWLDGYGKELDQQTQVLICFRGIARWEELLTDENGPVCLHVLRSKVEVMDLHEAGRLAAQRYRRVQARKRRALKRQAQVPGQLAAEAR